MDVIRSVITVHWAFEFMCSQSTMILVTNLLSNVSTMQSITRVYQYMLMLWQVLQDD